MMQETNIWGNTVEMDELDVAFFKFTRINAPTALLFLKRTKGSLTGMGTFTTWTDPHFSILTHINTISSTASANPSPPAIMLVVETAWLPSPDSCIFGTMKELEATFWDLYFFKGSCKVLSKWESFWKNYNSQNATCLGPSWSQKFSFLDRSSKPFPPEGEVGEAVGSATGIGGKDVEGSEGGVWLELQFWTNTRF